MKQTNNYELSRNIFNSTSKMEEHALIRYNVCGCYQNSILIMQIKIVNMTKTKKHTGRKVGD